MKILLKPFVALATSWSNSEFFRARVKLSLVYALIVAVVMIFFSSYLQILIHKQFERALFRSADLSESEAVAIAATVYGGVISDVSIEVRFDTLVYAIEVIEPDQTETDVFINAYNGQVEGVFKDTVAAPESWGETFLNDFNEHLLWLSILIILLGVGLGYWLAGYTLRPIEKKMRQHERFSADAAHELRTPLAALYARVDAGLRLNEVNRYKDTLHDIKQETRRLINLTEKLLETNRADKAGVTVSLKAIISRVVSNLSELGNEKGVSFRTDLKDFILKGSETDLEELVFNLLHNAIKFSNHGGVVEVFLDASGRLKVKDGGVGISPEDQPYIFDRFFTADKSREQGKQSGFGLGLAIVKRIAEEHKAKLSVSSKPNEGTIISINFLQ